MKTLNPFYFVVARRIKRLTLLCEIDYLSPPYFVFVNVIMFYVFASFGQIIMNNEIHLDCKTVGFFLKISKEIGKAWRNSPTRSLTRPCLSPVSLSVFSLIPDLYEKCGVKNYIKENYRSYRRNFCSCEKKA